MSSFILKILAIFFMIIDHTGLILFPNHIIFRIIGRLALPLFAYQIAVGFSHTKNKPKHILKLLFFAFLAQIPYGFMLYLGNFEMQLNILFTFVLALIISYLLERIFTNKSTPITWKYFINLSASFIIVLSLILLGCFLQVDYGWYGILLTIAFYLTLKNKFLSIICFVLLVIIKFFVGQTLFDLLAFFSLTDVLFILMFNGKKGYNQSWIFYLVYLTHLVPLLLLKYIPNYLK